MGSSCNIISVDFYRIEGLKWRPCLKEPASHTSNLVSVFIYSMSSLSFHRLLHAICIIRNYSMKRVAKYGHSNGESIQLDAILSLCTCADCKMPRKEAPLTRILFIMNRIILLSIESTWRLSCEKTKTFEEDPKKTHQEQHRQLDSRG